MCAEEYGDLWRRVRRFHVPSSGVCETAKPANLPPFAPSMPGLVVAAGRGGLDRIPAVLLMLGHCALQPVWW
jgi:hypothetical protein